MYILLEMVPISSCWEQVPLVYDGLHMLISGENSLSHSFPALSFNRICKKPSNSDSHQIWAHPIGNHQETCRRKPKSCWGSFLRGPCTARMRRWVPSSRLLSVMFISKHYLVNQHLSSTSDIKFYNHQRVSVAISYIEWDNSHRVLVSALHILMSLECIHPLTFTVQNLLIWCRGHRIRAGPTFSPYIP